MIEQNSGHIQLDCGIDYKNFNENFLLNNLNNLKYFDYQGSHWAPHLIHSEIWKKIGGFSEEFNPGDGSDPDFCMKLWINKVRIFKAISKFKVYHFSSVTTRKSNIILNNGTKTFLLKFGFNPRFFRKYYLKGDGLNVFKGKLNLPYKSFIMLFDLFINKLKLLYLILIK